MAWIRYESGVLKHPKWQAIPFAARANAMALHVACSGYAGDYLTDGYVPDNILPSIAHEAGVKDLTKTVTNLRTARLIRKVRGGLWIHDYLDYNPSKEEVKKKRAEDAARKKAARQKGLDESVSIPPSDADSDADSEADSDADSEADSSRPRPHDRAGAGSLPLRENLNPKNPPSVPSVARPPTGTVPDGEVAQLDQEFWNELQRVREAT